MMKVVIDTNVWLSALLWGGQPSLIIQLIELPAVKDNHQYPITPDFHSIEPLSKQQFCYRF